MTWTTSDDLRRQAQRLWSGGRLGRSVVRAAAPEVATDGDDDARPAPQLTFPLRLRLKRPSSAELSDRYDEARAWIADLSRLDRVRILTRTVNHRVLGANDVPAEAWVDSLDDALALAGRTDDAKALATMTEAAVDRRPALVAWLDRRPVTALEHVGAWDRLLDFIDWLEAHPNPDRYLRQVSVAGIDTKFTERHRAVLGELIDLALPGAVVDPTATGTRGFEPRLGFRSKPNLVRFRILDRNVRLGGLPPAVDGCPVPDISVDADTFARLDVAVSTVFIVENEVNFLAFPEVDDAMVMFGSGFGTKRLEAATWLADRRLRYWGDIDTHGFAILDELRRRFGSVESFLMDRATLDAHAEFWSSEPSQETRDLPRLTVAEAGLYDALRTNQFGPAVRLEQERISYDHVRPATRRP